VQNPLKYIHFEPGTVFTGLCSVILAGVLAFGNFQRHDGVSETKQVDLERRVVVLENDRATRQEVHSLAESLADFKKDTHDRLSHMEDLLIQDLRARR
jgi:hypothetical protein